jgi:hypothetical protein
MRTYILVLTGVCLLTGVAIAQESGTISRNGQDAGTPLSRTIFKLSPQHFTHNSLKAGIERFNGNHSGSTAFFLTGMMNNNQNTFQGDGYNGMAGELQLRKYISPMKSRISKRDNVYHQGIYGAAYFQGGYYSGDFQQYNMFYDPNTGNYERQLQYDYRETVGNWGFGFTIGYQRTLWQVIFMEAFIGGGVQFSSSSVSGVNNDDSYYDYEGITDPSYEGILPKFGLNIGIGL